MLVLIVAAGVIGTQNPMHNLAPTMIWVVWWVGFAYLSALVSDVWQIVNPWSTLFALIERATGGDARGVPRVVYPRALGAWPAVVLFGGFAWIELVFDGRAIPAQLALITLGYSAITWVGMATFGRAVWLRHGDPFAIAFGLFARFAPAELRVNQSRQ
jgi:polyferredoxin